MATNNQINVGLSGASGTGSFAGTTSPVLVTPTLGVASATSINFGVDALSYYAEARTFTPTVTFATPGDLSVAYSIQNAVYWRIGNMVFVSITIRFTPTYTTASGQIRFGGLPFTVSSASNCQGSCVQISEATTWPVGATMAYLSFQTAATTCNINGSGTATVPLLFGSLNFPTATQKTVLLTGWYVL